MPPSVAVRESLLSRFCPYRTLRRSRSVRLSVCAVTVRERESNTRASLQGARAKDSQAATTRAMIHL